ncbi:SusC/RagA family TonB-linked outer membrane protein [Chryseobacterium rhizoplanae]|uniref:SusC/RagA family TonB-linked outer membrane protein n=1 Tax=Chryseobacterium rhizoplanae TaxID=1609531 RepID=UPI001CE31407|nr:SusC/RagA family TonB-linked outer membrane protein [Chryseobacterium rhizoplanae]UCA61752.1 SusC/RagA family TonB-linked outer membrane protein [Chryseobacterium rhizoplanae]
MKNIFCRGPLSLVFTISAAVMAYAQNFAVTGTVSKQNGLLPGVIVRQEGKGSVTITNDKGQFSLAVEGDNPVLIFEHPDYLTKKETLRNRTTLLIKLSSSVKQIEEVVLNAGYYKVKDKERTGSISKVTAKEIENQPVTNVLSAVQGRMAGVNIIQNTGTPGGGFDVQIRGRNSLRTYNTAGMDANTPLYVIDGVPVITGNTFNSGLSAAVLPYGDTNPLNTISAGDIENIEILKDADATAIYGSRGSNGVILITTKKGKKGRTQVNANLSYGLGSQVNLPKMMGTADYLLMRARAYKNDGITNLPTNAYDLNGTWNKDKYTDFQKYFVGGTSEYNNTRLGISGGNNTTSFNISAGHDQQTTVFPGDYRYKRNTVSATVDHQSEDKKLKLNLSAYYTTQDNFLPPADFSTIYGTLAPNSPDLYNPDGSINWQQGTFRNPLAAATKVYRTNSHQLISNVTLQYQLMKNLKIQINSGYTHGNTGESKISPKTAYNPAANIGSERSELQLVKKENSSWIVEPQLNFDKKWGNHSFQALVGTSFQEQTSDNLSLYGNNFPSDELIMDMASAKTVLVLHSMKTVYRYQAVYGRLNYQYNKKYILNLTGRRDGSSRFGPGKRFANFGAIGAAWIFSNEYFLKESKWLSFGKLRGSYGTSGSDLIGDYQFYDSYQALGYPYGGLQGISPTRLFNPDFSWEETKKLEIALETGFFKDRFNLTASWYRNRTSNQLVGIPLPLTTGFSSVNANLNATVQNSGYEFTFGGQIIKRKDFNWNTSLNISFPVNKLIAFPDLEGSSYANSFVVGKSTNIRKLYHFLGVNPITGIYQFEDINKDGQLDLSDRNIIKEIKTYWFGGLQSNFKYKNWSLDLLFQFSKQNVENIFANIGNLGIMGNRPELFLDYWTPDNPHAQFQMPSSGANAQASLAATNFRMSDTTISTIHSLKFKNISLSYRLPEGVLGATNASVYFQGQNLWLWSDYKGIDPEFSLMGYTAPLRVFSFGFTLTL